MGDIECVAPVGDRVGEGAVWSADEQAVYWCDINRFLIHRFEIASATVRSFFFDEPVTALALTTEAGTLLAALGSRLILWRPATDERRDHGFRLPGSPAVRFNDGRPDPRGDFWIGSMANNVRPDGEGGDVPPGLGKLFRVRAGDARVMVEPVGIANTLCWSPDRKLFYFADTLANLVSVYAYDEATGDISDGRPFFRDFARGLPDGSAMDAEGCLWNARFGGGCVVRVRPDGAMIASSRCRPSTSPPARSAGRTSRPYITTAGYGGKPGQRLAGSLFAQRVPVPGLPENRVRL